MLAVPLFAIGWILAVTLWAERTGVNLMFRRASMSGHGSARFANAKERAELRDAPDGLLIGRDAEHRRGAEL